MLENAAGECVTDHVLQVFTLLSFHKIERLIFRALTDKPKTHKLANSQDLLLAVLSVEP